MQHLQPNTTLQGGKYRIEQVLGQGGFGNTYVGVNTVFNERVAIKEFFMKGVTQRDDNQSAVSVSNSENIDSFQQQKEKFKKEARRIRQLKNEHIVAVHDLFEENGTAYYVMDYVDGENLAERLKRTGRPMTEQEVSEILPQILDALKAVHDEGFCHLDLKPSNIMLDRNGTIKLIDFGASKQMAADGSLTTNAPTAFARTPGYAPRELMEQNYKNIGPWTDIYSLGATLYVLLTNEKLPPLPSDIDDDVTEDKHIALPFPDSIRAETKSMVLAMLNTNRLQRPQTIDTIADIITSNKATPQQQVNQKNSSKNYCSDEETIIDTPKRAIEREKPVTKPQNAQEQNVKHQPNSTPHDDKSGKDGNSGNGASGCAIFCMLVGGVVLVLALISILNNNAHKNSIDNGKDVIELEVETEEETAKNGYFEESYDDGSSYKGNFKDGLYHDWGTYIWANGNKYEGKWNKGNMVKGTFTWPEKRKNYIYKYVGKFKNNKREGEGTAYYVGGETRSGLWKNGELVESKTNIENNEAYKEGETNDIATSKGCYEQAKKLRINGQGDKAIEFFLKAYRIGESPYKGWALHQIGCIYYLGLGGIKNNYYEGFRYFKMASDIGVLPSKYYLGICYKYGRGVQQDESKANELISASGYMKAPGYDF